MKHPAGDNPSGVTKYIRYEKTINMRVIKYPVKIQQVNKFEKQNHDISVNIFGHEEKKIFPIRVTENKGRNHHVKLLLINNGNKYHYILIKDLSRLLSSQYKGYNRRLFFVPIACMVALLM